MQHTTNAMILLADATNGCNAPYSESNGKYSERRSEFTHYFMKHEMFHSSLAICFLDVTVKFLIFE